MELNIEIETDNRMLGFDLFESKEIRAGQTQKAIGEGISIRYEGGLIRRAVDFPEIVRIALVIAEKYVLPVAATLTATWLYDKLKGRANNVIIEHTVVEIDEGEIKKVIIEKLRKTRT